ncbi:MAG: protease inhibitor I9 family protein, partial [Actinomycetota bacterium]
MRIVRLASAAGLLVLGVLSTPPAGAQSDEHEAVGPVETVEEPVPDQFIVVLEDTVSAAEVDDTTDDLADEHDGEVLYTYDTAIQGFAAELTPAEAAKLAADPRVASVEENARVTVSQAEPVQTGATWGLDRIDQV